VTPPPRPRITGVAGVFALLLAVLAGRAVDLALVRGPALADMAARQHRHRVALHPRRGPIVDRHGESLALSGDVPSLFVRPREWAGQDDRVAALAGAVGLPVDEVRRKVGSSQPFVWLKRQATPAEAEAMRALRLRGVHQVTEGRRFYPHGALAAHVLGFVGVDSQGLEGLERRLDVAIRGEPRWVEVDRDARGRELLTAGVQKRPRHGATVELTLDAAIQDATERELAAGVAAARAAAGAAIVLDPATGEILALANVPTFSPNKPGGRRDRRWRDRIRNRAITDPYEPGSTFKAMLAAAALDTGVVRPQDMIFCENGRFPYGRWTINDAHPHGWLSFAEVVQYSSNIGTSKVAEKVGRERYAAFLRAFGFGQRTGIDLPGESAGIVRAVERWARIDLATHSFGQGIAVTPLQMAAAFAALANDGVLMRPYVVRRIVGPGGRVLRENEPVAVRRVVSSRTARTVTTLLRRVVEEKGGTGSRAKLEDFSVAGKTGTSQKVDPVTGAYSAKRIGSFAGFVPADAPRMVIVVVIDEPQTSSYGGVVAAPVFKSIAAAVLGRLGVVPSAPPAAAPAVRAAAAPRVPKPRPRARAAAGAEPAPPPDGRPAMPSFLGLSLREALARAQEDGWAVEVTGTGYVQEQAPPPGAPPAADRRLALRLVPGEGTASP
jgi:cell division protein FtsI (penicillin-binding protein 3)